MIAMVNVKLFREHLSMLQALIVISFYYNKNFIAYNIMDRAKFPEMRVMTATCRAFPILVIISSTNIILQKWLHTIILTYLRLYCFTYCVAISYSEIACTYKLLAICKRDTNFIIFLFKIKQYNSFYFKLWNQIRILKPYFHFNSQLFNC